MEAGSRPLDHPPFASTAFQRDQRFFQRSSWRGEGVSHLSKSTGALIPSACLCCLLPGNSIVYGNDDAGIASLRRTFQNHCGFPISDYVPVYLAVKTEFMVATFVFEVRVIMFFAR